MNEFTWFHVWNRMQTMRQQAMDDRRRAMMNEMYSRPSGAPPVMEDVEEEWPLLLYLITYACICSLLQLYFLI